MADSKNYIVRYDIQANTTEAATALESLVKKANEVAAPMKRVQSALQNTSKALFHLRQNSKFEFNPSINTTTFQSQLRSMLQEVRTVATQMHAAIYEALTANPIGTKAAQTGIKNAFKLASTTPELQKQLTETEKFLQQRNEQLKRFNKTFSQNLTQEQRANAEKQRAIAKADRDMLKERAANIRAALSAQEELDKKLVAQQEKTKKAVAKSAAVTPKAKTPTAPQPSPTTNVTPAVIREWGKVFGNAKSKSLTVSIRGNASGAGGALTVIEQVMTSLQSLQSQASFNITPTLNTEAFAAAEARLKQLAALSASITAPFAAKENKTKTGKAGSATSSLTKDEKVRLSNAQKQIKAWNEKIAPIQSRLDANKAIPENQRTPAIKGQITRDTKTLAAYTASRAEQEKIVSTLQSKSSAAVQSAAKTAQPLVLDIVGNLSKINTPAKPPVVPIVGEISKIQGKVTEAIPVNVKIMGDQVAASLKAVAPPPTLDVRVHLLTEGIPQQLQAISGQTKPTIKTTAKQSATPAATPAPTVTSRPVYTPPTFTAEDEKQLNSLAARYSSLAKDREKAEKAVASAKARLDKSGGSNRAYDNYLSAQRKLGDIKRQSTEVFNKLNPLMSRQFQSTAQRALTEEEIIKGIGAQNVVKQLEGKKRLTAVQKTQLAEANKTLTALRAPAQPSIESTPTPPIASFPPVVPSKTPAETPVKPVVPAQPANAKKTPSKSTITGSVDTKDIIRQIAGIPKQTIPIAVKLMWDKGAIGRQEQIKKLADNIPPIHLKLDTSEALAKLEEFIVKVKTASPQNINLTANGASPKTAPNSVVPVAPQKTPSAIQSQKPAVAPTVKKTSATDRVKKINQPQIPPISLTLDISGATASLEEFIAKIKASSPQNIQLTATGAVPKTGSKPSTPITPAPEKSKDTLGNKKNATSKSSTPASPISKSTGKETGKGVTQTKSQTIPLVLDTSAAITALEEFITKVKAASPQNIILKATGASVRNAPSTPATSTSAASTKIPAGVKENKSKTPISSSPTVPLKNTGRASGKPLTQPQPQTISLKLDTTDAVVKLEEFIAKVKAASPQNIKLTANGAAGTSTANQPNSKAPSVAAAPPMAPISTGGSTQKSNTQKGTTGYQASSAQERYDKLRKRSNERATKQLADNRFRAQKRAEYSSQQQAWYNQQQALYNKLFDPVKKPDLNWAYKEEQKRAAELAKMRDDAKTAFAKPTPFEQKEIDRYNQFLARQEEAKKISSATSISSHRNKLGKMRSAIRNSILPFVSNQGDLESIFKNYKSFARVNQAWGTIGADGKKTPFVPTPGMPNGQMLRYLTDVRTQMQADGAAVPVKLNNYIGSLEEQIRQSNMAPAVPQNTLAPSGFMGSGKNRVSFGTAKPSDVLAPKGYHWEKTKNLASRLSNPQMEGFQRALAEKEAAWQNLRRVQAATQGTIDAARNPRTPHIDRMTSISNTLSTRANTAFFKMGHALNAVDQYNNTINSLQTELRNVESQMQPFMAAKSLNPSQTSQLTNLAVRSNELKQQIAENENLLNQQKEIARKADRSHQILTQRRNAIDAARAMEENSVRSAMLAQPMADRRNARAAYTQARSNVNAYTQGYQLTADEPTKSSKAPKSAKAPHRVRTQSGELLSVEQLRAQAQNAMLPFAQNKEQLNMLTKHRRFFRQAVTATGIMPTPGMEAPQMLRYLQGVSNQMQQASVAVPWTLQNQINKLEDQVAASKGVGQPAPSRPALRQNGRVVYGGHPMSFYDRSRKWAYPFTGPSSFGVRTPMAVDMAKGMGVMFAIGGAMSAIGGSFSQAMEYQNTMRTTQAILQNGTESYSQGSFQNMEATVRNVGVKTKFSAPEVANAAKFLAMAGYDIDAINAAIRPIADLALIGDSDLGETADKMTNIMTTFNIAPDRMRQAANIMATTATRSNTDLMMLAESAKYGGGVAHMYGHNDPNLFADTMAIFGVMGNAGIQASSAGTSLRMMYQNIFNPNKKQAALLNLLESQYGISTKTANGEKRSMADIIIDMANKIPANAMPDIVGKLFRITAQPGANAALLSATDIAMQESGGDINTASNLVDETNAFVAKLSGKNSKSQLSALATLIQANRNSLHGNISGAIAEEKQNTIQGLWAQVTSTFTEGIVQAFEHRQGGFEEILKKLRDYFAKPETVQMLQNLMDMIIEIGKVMGWFVKIWANLYNAAPGMIKFWVVTQMAVTQMGTLIAPFISLLGVVNRLQRALGGFAGFSAVGGASNAMGRIAGAGGAVAGGAATSAAMNAPFIVGHTPKGKPKVISGNIAKRAHQAVAANARKVAMQDIALASSVLLPYPGGNTRAQMNARALNIPAMVERQNRIDALNNQTREHYAAVRERAKRIYGPARAGRAFKSAFYALPTMASFAPMFGGIKSMLMGLFTSLAKAAGFLVNPVTLAVGALTGLGIGLYKLKQRIDGNTDAQKASRVQANRAANQTSREMAKEGQWYRDLMSQDLPEANPVISSVNTNAINQSIAQKERFDQLYATIFNDFSKDASKQSVKDVAAKWQNDINSNPAYSLAIGNANNYDFSKKHKQLEYNPYNSAANVYIGWHNARYANEDDAINQRRGMVQDALMIEGANDTRTQQALKDITNLRQKYLAGETQYKSQSEYLNAAQQIRDKYMSQFSASIPAANMTPDQFKENRDRSVFDTYQMGARNLLDATIEGRLGTTVGKINAYEWLMNTKDKAKRYTDEWYNAIANIIGDYHVIYNAISADGKQQANVELILSSLPNGQLNFINIIDQIRAKVNNFNMTVQGFSDIIGTAYKMMAEAGVINIKDRTDLRNQILHQMAGATFNDETPKNYYRQWIGNNKNSEWVKAGISEEKYTDFIMGRSGKTLDLGNRVVTLEQERKQMWRNIAGKTADTILEQNKSLTEQAQKLSGSSPSNPPTPTQTPVKDQQAYASAYDHSAAKPTQIVFNINNLASFDRTTVASSAEERDLMAAMEERIAGAVYQIFAEASNQAQRVMDLT